MSELEPTRTYSNLTATELLRRMLDERGVEYKRHYLNTSWYVGMKLYMATDDVDGTLTVDNLTPEQAIAATLGSEREKRLEKLVQKALDECWCDEWWYEDATKLGMEANY